VAFTRPKHRLILSGITLGSGGKAAPLSDQIRAALPGLEQASDGSRVVFGDGGNGRMQEALVHIVAAEPQPVAHDVSMGSSASPAHQLVLPPDAVPAVRGLTRHSATELIAFERCERRHALKYVFGIREPETHGKDGRMPGGAVMRGQIVHDVLERWEEDAELEALVEEAIGRWDPNAPPPDNPTGVHYRADLREEVSRVLAMPEYAGLANADTARRELTFLRVLADGQALQGAIDLAATVGDGVSILDVKTSALDAGQVEAKTAQYTSQRDVYVSTADALGELPVHEFAFVFSRPGVSVRTTHDAASVVAADERVHATLQRMGAMPYSLATNPRACFFCGYRAAGICEGVEGQAG
jgi:ATP-dependent exoDNAse (exonuclease V) beta subunit